MPLYSQYPWNSLHPIKNVASHAGISEGRRQIPVVRSLLINFIFNSATLPLAVFHLAGFLMVRAKKRMARGGVEFPADAAKHRPRCYPGKIINQAPRMSGNLISGELLCCSNFPPLGSVCSVAGYMKKNRKKWKKQGERPLVCTSFIRPSPSRKFFVALEKMRENRRVKRAMNTLWTSCMNFNEKGCLRTSSSVFIAFTFFQSQPYFADQRGHHCARWTNVCY